MLQGNTCSITDHAAAGGGKLRIEVLLAGRRLESVEEAYLLEEQHRRSCSTASNKRYPAKATLNPVELRVFSKPVQRPVHIVTPVLARRRQSAPRHHHARFGDRLH